jgi:dipeptidyl aminopeptidase/acylaminoacyl peptidase
MKNFFTTLLILSTITLMAQKKTMNHDVYKIWKKIDNSKISNDGQWVAYGTMCNAECDGTLNLWNASKNTTRSFDRGYDFQFSFDNTFLYFKIKQPLDSLKAKRRKKVRDEDLPKDSLAILNLASGNLTKIANVKSYAAPIKWAGYVAYQHEIEKPAERTPPSVKDTSAAPVAPKSRSKEKAESKENGTKTILYNLASGKKDTFPFVVEYIFARKGKKFLFADSGKDSTDLPSVDIVDCDSGEKTLLFEKTKGKFKQLAMDDMGVHAAFIADLDTTKERVRPYELHVGSMSPVQKWAVAKSNSDYGDLQNYLVSDNAKPIFSEDGSKLFFGVAPQPILNDTTLLPEEIINVEVWSYNEKKIHTQQKVQLESEKKRSYPIVYHTGTGSVVPLGSPDLPDFNFAYLLNADFGVGFTSEPYQLASTWEGGFKADISLVNLNNGERTLAAKGVRGVPQVSPGGKYLYWYNELDSAWFAFSVYAKTTTQLTDNSQVRFYDEGNDMPDYPNSNGMAGWSKDDKYVLIYDRFDIWRIDPSGVEKSLKMTNGRDAKIVHRYIRLDNEVRHIDLATPLFLGTVNETTKSEAYVLLDASNMSISNLAQDSSRFSSTILKAKNANVFVFTKQNFKTFPDLLYTSDFKNVKKVSNVNPQQSEYNWGSVEIVKWRGLDGWMMKGMLIKPEGFDPKKKYPMIVNFYEFSSDQLHNYRDLEPLRSQINYSFYANRGYLIFNPDIPYKIGYPGESCMNSVVSGVAYLTNQGFVDPDRIAVQGHSWGGYQAAYLIAHTDMFRCAGIGAPVVNMFSAYGGIRWESGILRQFQYEHSQSRIGGSMWQYPLRYMENSPIFNADKINTPALILHNDKDGAVPWYQGIEFYSAMRRMNKPAWLLNYNDEPHWPVKLQNRIDYQIRMQQYFDYYLKDAAKPKWMQNGVPAIEKGINQGYDLIEKK